jgi:hypothetical protein
MQGTVRPGEPWPGAGGRPVDLQPSNTRQLRPWRVDPGPPGPTGRAAPRQWPPTADAVAGGSPAGN